MLPTEDRKNATGVKRRGMDPRCARDGQGASRLTGSSFCSGQGGRYAPDGRPEKCDGSEETGVDKLFLEGFAKSGDFIKEVSTCFP